MPGQQPTLRRILISALAALTVALGAASLIAGFSDSFPVRLVQGLAVFGAGAVIIGGAVVLTMIRLAGWHEPESEMDFEAIVQRAERIAAGDALDDTDYDIDDEDLFDPYEDEDFRALVRGAIDELPLEFHRALEHVAIVISDGGRRQRAYGLYQGDTVAQRLLPRPDRDLPRHAAARLRPRPGAAQGTGHAHRAPRARPPSRVGREGRPAASGSSRRVATSSWAPSPWRDSSARRAARSSCAGRSR